MNSSIVIPASPNSSAVYDMNAKWDHLFQGGGIFEMSSIFGVEYEYGNLTPPPISVISLAFSLMTAGKPFLQHFAISNADRRRSNTKSWRIYRLSHEHAENPTRVT
jgi:hypothetical protein